MNRQRVAPLRFHALVESVAVVDQEDVQDAQVQGRQEIGECGIGFERMHVRIDRLDGGQPGRRCGTSRLRADGWSDTSAEPCGGSDGEENDRK
jgi:hypothetical protein